MVINRRVLRGFALDGQCKDFGGIIREADGKGDPRRFAPGIPLTEAASYRNSAQPVKRTLET